MKKNKFLFLCIVIIAIGLVCLIAGISMGGAVNGIYLTRNGLKIENEKIGDISQSDGANNVINKEETEPFESVNLKMNYADCKIIASDHYGIEYCMPGVSVPEYSIKNGKLYVESNAYKGANWRLKIFGFGAHHDEKVEPHSFYVYMPSDTKGKDMKISLLSGRVILDNIDFDNIEIDNNFGDVEFENLKFDKLDIKANSGCIKGNSIRGNKAKISSGFGTSKIGEADVNDLTMDISFGQLDLGKVSGKMADISCSFAEMNIDELASNEALAKNAFATMNLHGASSDKLEISSSFGELYLRLMDINDYNMECRADFGDVKIDGKGQNGSYVVSDESHKKNILANCAFGEISIR